jgi:hypothetical protein
MASTPPSEQKGDASLSPDAAVSETDNVSSISTTPPPASLSEPVEEAAAAAAAVPASDVPSPTQQLDADVTEETFAVDDNVCYIRGFFL